MKKLLSLFLIAALLLVLAACGKPVVVTTEGTTARVIPTDNTNTEALTVAQATAATIPWDQLGKSVSEIRASLGEVESASAKVWLGAAMCGFREKDKELIYFLFGTQEIMWDVVPDYANQLIVAGFCVTPAMLLPTFEDGMTVADFLEAIGVTLDENVYGAFDEFGEEYDLSYTVGSKKLSMTITSYTIYGKGMRTLQADDYILIRSTAYTEKNEEDLGTKIPWDIISAASDAAWEAHMNQ